MPEVRQNGTEIAALDADRGRYVVLWFLVLEGTYWAHGTRLRAWWDEAKAITCPEVECPS